MSSRRRVYVMPIEVGLVVVLGAIAAIVGVEYYATDLFGHRLTHVQAFNDVRLEPPGLWPWPQLSYEAVPSFCKPCKTVPASNNLSRTTQLARLVSDDSVANSTSMTDVHLPRLVWVIIWRDACWSPQAAGLNECITFDIVDDKDGRELDGGQAWASDLR
jgi:hypothetical protein